MKVAVCLSGQPRYFEQTFKFLYRHILCHYDTDIFIHTWHDQKEVGQRYEGMDKFGLPGIYKEVREDTKEKILSIYKPKLYLFEPQRRFQGTDLEFIVRSLFYSIKICNKLKQFYERENDFRYDCVIRSRFDLRYKSDLNLNQFDLNNINARVCGGEKLLRGLNMDDNFAFSTSKNMDLYSQCYNKLDELSRYNVTKMLHLHPTWIPEFIMARHMLTSNLTVFNMPFEFSIIKEFDLHIYYNLKSIKRVRL